MTTMTTVHSTERLIPLEPVPASRPRVTRWGTYYTKRYKDWMVAATAFLPTPPSPFVGPVQVAIDVYCTRPKKPANEYPIGDIDNYAKATLDAVTQARIWNDDKQVTELTVRKHYAAPGARVGTFISITGETACPQRA